ncbi:recombination protein RecT [Mycobacterium syngnathidarum]
MGRDLAQRARTSVAQQADSKDLRQQLVKMQEQFQRAMPKGVEAVQLIRDVMTCMQQTPKLAQCDIPSVLGSAMTCAQLGLRPGVGALGQAWILPFYDNKTRGQRAQLIIGYKGYVELGHRSDRIASLHSRIVYANDLFDVEYGAAEDKWLHKPCLDGERGDAKLFYAVGRLANGGYSLTDPMTVADMEKHRDKFAMAKNRDGQIVGPWRDHFEAMGQKTMLLRLMALMPKSTELQRAMDNDGSVRVDLAAGAIDTPTHIDGEVIGDPVDEVADERESIDVRGPAQDPDGGTQETFMAGRDQIAKLKTAFKAEKLDDLDSQLAWLTQAVNKPVGGLDELTADEADQVLGILGGGAK